MVKLSTLKHLHGVMVKSVYGLNYESTCMMYDALKWHSLLKIDRLSLLGYGYYVEQITTNWSFAVPNHVAHLRASTDVKAPWSRCKFNLFTSEQWQSNEDWENGENERAWYKDRIFYHCINVGSLINFETFNGRPNSCGMCERIKGDEWQGQDVYWTRNAEKPTHWTHSTWKLIGEFNRQHNIHKHTV